MSLIVSMRVQGIDGGAMINGHSSSLVETNMCNIALKFGKSVVGIEHLLAALSIWVSETIGRQTFKELFSPNGCSDYNVLKLRRELSLSEDEIKGLNDRAEVISTSEEVDNVLKRAREIAGVDAFKAEYLLLALFELYSGHDAISNLHLGITPEKIMKEFAINLTPKL